METVMASSLDTNKVQTQVFDKKGDPLNPGVNWIRFNLRAGCAGCEVGSNSIQNTTNGRVCIVPEGYTPPCIKKGV